MNRPIQVCLCGGGSLAHALTAVLGAQPGVKVNLLTRRPAEWHKMVTAAVGTEYAILGRISSISNRPADVVPFADLVILTVPAFARTEVLRALQSFIQESSWVGSIPGHGGF